MLPALQEVFKSVDFSDLNDWGISAPVIDFLSPEAAWLSADWIITNPPFNLATEFLLRAYEIARKGVAFLVRINFLSGIERYNTIFRCQKPTLIAFYSERVPIIEGVWDPQSSTATDYVWLIWLKGSSPMVPVWFPPGMEEKYTKQSDMVLATPGEAARRLSVKKAMGQ
ncbi:methyltransferase [Allorhizobium sp. BGMRC 0089]|uniref:methyltransferase n=1 Tax=Allorhizobium sonneratiae TaxID=2934936 RepID=UPI00203471DE|nr:methyltransferase [Allorhizobium sonneratiae]MCM2294684.1 methyltransferase [Allorhizobium sonneratiae]